MNNFYTDNFNISKIIAGVYVQKGSGQAIHKNRASHGLVLNLSGVRTYKFDNGEEMTTPSDSVFYLPKFSNYEVEATILGDCIAINFDLTDTEVTYPHFSLTPALYSNYEKNFIKFLKCWNLKQNGYLNVCTMLLYNIICDIQQDTSKAYVPSKQKKIVDDATLYIQKNISDFTLTVAHISEQSGISPEYFRKLFRDVYGVSPRKYIIEARIKKAKELIRSGEFRIGEISELCGFESMSYFSREFKKHTGSTPSDYL